MEIAKMTSKGQITVPKAIREKLDIGPGDKVLFVQRGNDWVMINPSRSVSRESSSNGAKSFDREERAAMVKRILKEAAPEYDAESLMVESLSPPRPISEILAELQGGFKGVAEASGWETEDDVVEYIKALRRGEVD